MLERRTARQIAVNQAAKCHQPQCEAHHDDDALSGEFLQPRQRFDKHFRLLVGAQVGVHVEVESRSFEFFGHSYSISFRSQR